MSEQGSKPSHLFTLRVWSEVLDDDQTEWRGKVLHVPSGEVKYFRNWDSLVEFVRQSIETLKDDQHGTGGSA